MNYRRIVSRMTIIALSTIAVILFMWSITQNNAQAKFLFEASISYGAGSGPHSVAIGDLNGDGELDLAVANIFANTVSILTNDGSGAFAQTSIPAVGSGPRSVAGGDLDGDGDLDLAVDSNSDTVSILTNDGSGAFALTTIPVAGMNPSGVNAKP